MGSHRSSPRPSSMGRRAVKSWEGQDVHTGWYRLMCTYKRPRIRSRAKRHDRRRERLEAKRQIWRDLEV